MSEQIALAQLLRDKKLIYSTPLKADDFSIPLHRRLFIAIKKCVAQGFEPDILTVHDVEPSLSIADIDAIYESHYSSANHTMYAGKIKCEANKRRLREVLRYATSALSDGQDTMDVIAELYKSIIDLTAETGAFKVVSIADSMSETIAEIERLYNLHGKLPGISTGLRRLDQTLLGYRKRRLHVIGARPSGGKTAFMVDSIVKVSREAVVGVISAESGRTELEMRMLANQGNMDGMKIASGNLGTKTDFLRIFDASQTLASRGIYWYDEPNLTLDTLVSRCRELKERHKADIIYVDYIQIVRHKGDDRERIQAVSMMLKQLSRELDIPIVAMAQLNRGAEPGKRPHMSDFKGSGQIEQDADVVILLWHKTDPDESYLVIDKNRDGVTNLIDIAFRKETMKWTEIENERTRS